MKLRVRVSSILLLLALTPALAHPQALLQVTVDSFRDARTLVLEQVPLLSGRLLADFYARRDHRLAWTDPVKVDALLRVIEASPADGFVPEDFHVETVRALSRRGGLEALSESDRIRADLQLSDALLRYVHHTRYGKLDPVTVDPKWNDRDPIPAETLIVDMEAALAADAMPQYLASRVNTPFWYDDLRQALQAYLELSRLAALPPLPSGPNLAEGNRGPRVALLRERLGVIGGQGPVQGLEPEVFDGALRDQVAAFQRRVGLAPDGVVGPATLVALNRPFDAAQLERIRINLERMRWFYDELPADYLFVDVADYMIQVVRDGDVVWNTRAIVGKPETQTPMFRDSIDHLVFNPTWTVPVSIQKKMGRVSDRYTLVDRQTGRRFNGGDASNYKRYRVVQQPGPSNALGRVKFMFPNRHAVYLHDTPSRGLFGRGARALSNGCVRVQNPTELAEIILDRPDWNQAEINRTIERSRTRYVHLEEGLPVLLYYLTARANAQGTVDFRPDIYGRDQALLDAFRGPVLSARIAFPAPPPPPGAEPVSPPFPAIEPPADHRPDTPIRATPPTQEAVRWNPVESGAT